MSCNGREANSSEKRGTSQLPSGSRILLRQETDESAVQASKQLRLNGKLPRPQPTIIDTTVSRTYTVKHIDALEPVRVKFDELNYGWRTSRTSASFVSNVQHS